MRRYLAIFAVVMCIASCAIPMAFADEVLAASSDIRIAGFGDGLSTLSPSPVISQDKWGGIFVHSDIFAHFVTVSDVTWTPDNSDCGGYFHVSYMLQLEATSAASFTSVYPAVCAIPVEDTDARMEWRVTFEPDECSYTYPDNKNMIYGMSTLSLHKLNGLGLQYSVDMNEQSMMSIRWYPTSADAEISRIYIDVKIWDPDCVVVTETQPLEFIGWITRPFDILLDNVIVLQTVQTFATAPVMSDYLMMGASFLVILIIIKGL